MSFPWVYSRVHRGEKKKKTRVLGKNLKPDHLMATTNTGGKGGKTKPEGMCIESVAKGLIDSASRQKGEK